MNLKLLLDISDSTSIHRRYFVVNGFDGALTMLGLILGFLVSDAPDIEVALNVCLGAAVALAVSGISSAYISERSERGSELKQLEEATLSDLSGSMHAAAAKWIPWTVALINGLAPFCISLCILSPLWLDIKGVPLPLYCLHLSVVIAGVVLFFMGIFLGRQTGRGWLVSGLQTMSVAAFTSLIIFALTA